MKAEFKKTVVRWRCQNKIQRNWNGPWSQRCYDKAGSETRRSPGTDLYPKIWTLDDQRWSYVNECNTRLQI